MKNLMTYEGLFDFLKKKKKVVKTDSDKEIIDTCKDILIELGDLGYTYDVDGYRRHNHNILTKSSNELMNEVEIRVKLYLPDIYHKVLPEEEITELLKTGLIRDQLKDFYERLSSYLASQGFKLNHKNRDNILDFKGNKLSSENFGLDNIGGLLIWIWTAEYI